MLATTATANARVTRDVAEQLGTGGRARRWCCAGRWTGSRCGWPWSRCPPRSSGSAGSRPGSAELPGSGIVYALTVAAAQETAAFLREQGLTVASYTGRDDPEERARAEDDLLANRVKALVATSALGMGFDKPDLGFVVHLGAPQSPVAYYQQIGRAGRALSAEQGDSAEVILLPGREDRDIWAYFASLAFPPERQVRATLAVLAEAGRPLSHQRAGDVRGPVPRPARVHAQGARRGRRGAPGQRRLDGDRPAVALRRRALRAGRGRARPRAGGHAGLPGHWRVPDGVPAAPARRSGRGGHAAAATTAPGSARDGEVPEASTAAARERLLRPGVTVEPRRMWPTGMAALGVDVAGKIPAELTAGPGRALGRLTDIGWGGLLRALLAEGAPDEPVSEPVVAAVIKVLAAWDWAQRPAGVLTLPSRTRPRLITSLGRQLASVGRLPYLGALAYTGADGPGPRRHNSAQRLSSLWRALEVPDEVREAVGSLNGPVLVVDDRIETGWTMTVAARLLREAGAPAALPLTLAVTTG